MNIYELGYLQIPSSPDDLCECFCPVHTNGKPIIVVSFKILY